MLMESFMEKKQQEKRVIDELIETYKLRTYGIDRFLKEKDEEIRTKYEFTFLSDPSSNSYLVKLINKGNLQSKEGAEKILKKLYKQRSESFKKEGLFKKDFFKTA